LSLLSGVLLLGLSYEAPPRGSPQPVRRIVHETLDGFRALGRHRDAGLLIGLALAQTLTRGFLNVFLVVVAIQLLGMGAPGVGVLTAAVGAGAVAGSLGASALVNGRRLAGRGDWRGSLGPAAHPERRPPPGAGRAGDDGRDRGR
jgi:hypothetical protein